MGEEVTTGVSCGNTDVEAGPKSGGNASILCERGIRTAISLESFEEENDGGGVEELITTGTSIEAAASGNRSRNPKKRVIEKLLLAQEVGNINKCSSGIEGSVTVDTSIEAQVPGNNRSPNPKRRATEKLIVVQEVVSINEDSTSKEEVSEGKPRMEARKAVGNETPHLVNTEDTKPDRIVKQVSPTKMDKQKKQVLIVTPNDSVEEYLNNCLRENKYIVVKGVNRAEDIESDCDMVCIDCSALGLKGGLYLRRRIMKKRQKKSLITLAIVMDATLKKAHPHAIRVLCETFTGICILPASEEDVRECLYRYLGVINNTTEETTASTVKQGKCYADTTGQAVYVGRQLRSSLSLPRAILKRIDYWPDLPQLYFFTTNQACLKLLGCESRTDLHGHPLSAFFSLDSGGDAQRLVRCIQRHSPTCGKLPVLYQGEGTVDVSVSLKPLGDSYPDNNLSCLTVFPLEFW